MRDPLTFAGEVNLNVIAVYPDNFNQSCTCILKLGLFTTLNTLIDFIVAFFNNSAYNLPSHWIYAKYYICIEYLSIPRDLKIILAVTAN
jgi:hypothetical protein